VSVPSGTATHHLACSMHRRALAMAEALVLTGVFGGFVAVVSAVLWVIGAATGGPGEEPPDGRSDLDL
jgi:hypothetical protein